MSFSFDPNAEPAMLHYPKISARSPAHAGRCIGFEKIDDTNTHWDWHRDFGWHSFGTRRDAFAINDVGIAAFAEKHGHLREAVEVFRDSLQAGLDAMFAIDPFRSASDIQVFAEFAGPNSFAGLHRGSDPKSLRMFDVLLDGRIWLGPEEFVDRFAHLPTPRIVYRGKLTGKVLDDVREGRLDVAEGVVFKGGESGSEIWMCKAKTHAYMARLKQAFADRWEDYWE